MTSSDFDFEDLLDNAQQISQEVEENFTDKVTNEFGELVDEAELEQEVASPEIVNYADDEDDGLAQTNPIPESRQLGSNATSQRTATWLKGSVLSISESEKEFEMFSCYCRLGGGRTLKYVAEITNLSIDKVKKVALRNNWQQRAADFDRYQLSQKINLAQEERNKRHLQRLEEYRQQQEQIGQQLSLSAARIAYLANRKLTEMADSEQNLDVRDLPSMLNAASKLAEVGKNLQGNALGVDQLLAAIEEAEVD